MSMAPLVHVLSEDVPAVTIAASDSAVLGVVPFGGTVTRVTYVPKSTITGVSTNSRAVSLVNRGTAGAGAVSAAGVQYNAGVNAPADVEHAITLAAIANRVVAAGDVLEWTSAAVGTGLADPGGIVVVTVERT